MICDLIFFTFALFIENPDMWVHWKCKIFQLHWQSIEVNLRKKLHFFFLLATFVVYFGEKRVCNQPLNLRHPPCSPKSNLQAPAHIDCHDDTGPYDTTAVSDMLLVHRTRECHSTHSSTEPLFSQDDLQLISPSEHVWEGEEE